MSAAHCAARAGGYQHALYMCIKAESANRPNTTGCPPPTHKCMLVCWVVLGLLTQQWSGPLTSSDAGSGSFSGLRGGDHKHM